LEICLLAHQGKKENLRDAEVEKGRVGKAFEEREN